MIKGNSLIKLIYRIIILIAIFVAALSYFSRDIKEVVFDLDNTTVMENVTFPLVSLKIGDNRINLLHGYSSNLEANRFRETVTPLDANQSFEVWIRQEDYEIKKLNYEVREFVGNKLIETDSVSVFDDRDSERVAKIKIKNGLEKEKEYALKITLISSRSDKMYFYQRIKLYDEVYLKEKLDFILNFHKDLLKKNTAKNLTKYLEPKSTADNSSLAYVNINSSFDLVSWGELKPTVLTEIIPDIKEIYPDIASVELNYIMKAEVAGSQELYRVTEFYRIRYTPDRVYLLNYERRMESMFDITLASTAKNELKLGITKDLDIAEQTVGDKTKLAFVRNRELWFYNLQENQITKVFSFRQDNTDYIRDIYNQHDIRIVNMDAEGNIDFMVYGYMNRGQYEGKVAIVLYRFTRAENRIEELLYIPVEESFQTLKQNLGELSYINSKEVFYFNIYNSIYSYNLITKELTELASNINKNNIVVLKKLNYVIWQETSDPKLSERICIMNMETGEIDTINTRAGYNIRLLDMIDSNIIYGFVDKGDITSMVDGSLIAPLSVIEIATVDKRVLKTYHQPGYYISGLEVKDNIVELRRVQKVTKDGKTSYQAAEADYIMNQVKNEPQLISISSRVTDQTLTEYYVTLPSGFVMKELPEVLTTVSTVIAEDRTVRLEEPEQGAIYYYPYIMGGIEGAYENAADAIRVAKDSIGVVLDNRNRLVWERGIKAAKYIISDMEALMNSRSTDGNSVEACIELLLKYQKTPISMEQISGEDGTAYEILKKYSKFTPIRLTGVALEDALYYVSKGKPIIAMTDVNTAVLIYGYDSFNIMIIDPSANKIAKMGIQDSAKIFENAGNIFISYLE